MITSYLRAQTLEGCADLTAADFERSSFDVGNRPISADFLTHPDGTYDVYFAHMNGDIMKRTAAGDVTSVVSLETENFTYAGLTSFLFHPDFRDNGWVFTSRMVQTPGWTGPNNLGAYSARIARHDFNALTGTLSNEKVLLDIPQIAVKNIGGSQSLDRARDDQGTYAFFQNAQMRFDSKGNLYANLGADHRSHESYIFTHDPAYISSSAEARAADTKELNGILRIHPDDSPAGYSIPAGNFREYWEARFTAQGNTMAAAEYSLAADKVAPEIYTKGHRTNWTLKIHPKKDWLIWGEVGVTGSTDEIGIVKHPVFAGYPYFYGNNDFSFRYYEGHYDDNVVDIDNGYDRTQNASLSPLSRADTNAPQNLSPFNEGVTHLPPAFNPQISSQRYQSRTGGVRLSDVGLPYVTNGAVGGNQAADDSWYETSIGEVASRALPPVESNMTRYTTITAGGIYSFDLALNNPNKFPAHLDEYLFIFDHEQARGDVAKVFDMGDRVAIDTVIDIKSLLQMNGMGRIIDGSFAPDGTLFMSAENGTIYNITYTGDCVQIDTNYVEEVLPALIKNGDLIFRNSGVEIKRPGEYIITLYNTMGQSARSIPLNEIAYYRYADLFPGQKESAVMFVKVVNKKGSSAVKRILLKN